MLEFLGRADRQVKIRGVLRSWDPSARKLRQALNTLRAGGHMRRRMRQAARRVFSRGKLRGLNAWRECAASRALQFMALRRGAAALLAVSAPGTTTAFELNLSLGSFMGYGLRGSVKAGDTAAAADPLAAAPAMLKSN